MIPRFYRSTPPQYTAPGGQMAVANVGVGQAISQFGQGLKGAAQRKLAREDTLAVNRAWRTTEEWLLGYLRQTPGRREELAQTQSDPAGGSTITGYQAEIDRFPDLLAEQFNLASAGLSGEAKEAFELRANDHAPAWADHVVQTLSKLELEDITTEIQNLAKTDRLADAQELLEAYGDRYSPTDQARLAATIEDSVTQARLANAQQFLQDMATDTGWDAAAELIADPEWQQKLGLDIADAAANLNVLQTFVRANAGRAERLEAAKTEQAKSGLFADALAGKLDDPMKIDQALRTNTVSHAEAKQLYDLMKKGPAEVSDPDVYLEALHRVEKAKADPDKRSDALGYLRRNVTKLTPANYQSLAAQTYATGAPDDPLSAPTVKLLNGLIDETYDQGGYGEWGTPDAQRQYIDAKERFIAYAKAHPEASDDDLNAEYRRVTEPIAKPTWLGRIRDWFLMPGTLTGSLLNPQPIDAETPPVTFQQADETATPESLEEFERVLMSLPNGSKAQKDYYEKWADRWR